MTHIKFGSLIATLPLSFFKISKRPFSSCVFITLTSLVAFSTSNTALASGTPNVYQTQPCPVAQSKLQEDLKKLSPSDFYNKYNAHKPPLAGTNTEIDYNFVDNNGECSYLGYTIHAWDTTVTAADDSGIVITKGTNDTDNDNNQGSSRDRDYVIDLTQETKDNINKGVIAYNNIAPIYNRINDIEKGYRASTAGMAAMVNIPQVTRAGANLLAVGVGHFKGENAVAVGFSSASDNESLIFKISGSANTQHDVAVGSGLGYQW